MLLQICAMLQYAGLLNCSTSSWHFDFDAGRWLFERLGFRPAAAVLRGGLTVHAGMQQTTSCSWHSVDLTRLCMLFLLQCSRSPYKLLTLSESPSQATPSNS